MKRTFLASLIVGAALTSSAAELNYEFTLPFPVGDLPGMSVVGNTLWMVDANNGLVKVDIASGIVDDLPTNPDLLWSRYAEATSVMTRSADGTKLYVLAPNAADPNDVPGNIFPWRDLNVYTIATDTWSLVSGEAVGGGIGDHSPALAVVNGQERLYHAWLGASEYATINTDNTRGPGFGGVGNRWGGSITEAYGDGTTDPAALAQLFALVQVDEFGNRTNNCCAIEKNAIARVTFDGAGFPLVDLVTPGVAAILPWETNCPDGGCVNRHSMEYVPSTNEIWVLRGANTNEIGIYNLTTNSWRVVTMEVLGSPYNVRRADIQLVGDEMYVINWGQADVYSLPVSGGGPAVPGDTDLSGCVDDADLTNMILDFGAAGGSSSGFAGTDVNSDGIVDDADLTDLILSFGTGC